MNHNKKSLAPHNNCITLKAKENGDCKLASTEGKLEADSLSQNQDSLKIKKGSLFFEKENELLIKASEKEKGSLDTSDEKILLQGQDGIENLDIQISINPTLQVFKNEICEYFINCDHCAEYVFENYIGKGYSSQTYEAKDTEEDCTVAVKIFFNTENANYFGLKEIAIMKKLNNEPHPNIVQMLDYFQYKDNLSIVYEKLDISLYELMENTGFIGFPLNDISALASQLVQALIFARNLNIVHSDLRPENILFVKKFSMNVKIIGWKSSKEVNDEIKFTPSHFYVTPEQIYELSQCNYQNFDLWSLGCIVGELYMGLPVFPGNSEYDQILKISALLGLIHLSSLPSNEFFKQCKSDKFFVNEDFSVRMKTKEEYEKVSFYN